MLAELHARWEREDAMARNMKVCTITTTSDVVSNASNPLTLIGVEKIPTPCAKLPKTAKTFSNKSAEIFRSLMFWVQKVNSSLMIPTELFYA
jgi:hypothetical protein